MRVFLRAIDATSPCCSAISADSRHAVVTMTVPAYLATNVLASGANKDRAVAAPARQPMLEAAE